MKKMAADRRDSDPKPLIPELKVSEAKRSSPMPVGGPVGPPTGPPGPPPTRMFGQPGIPRMPPGGPGQQQLIFM